MIDAPTTDPWQSYEPDEQSPWNRRRVVHLHRRAGFAATCQEIKRDLADGPQAAVDRLMSDNARSNSAPADFELMSRTIGDAAASSGNIDRLKAWWVYRMVVSPDPLRERLTLLWHNHFATSNRKVQNVVFMHEQNELLRKYARGRFAELLAAVIKHPAMLLWLDADSNRRDSPNENLARELLELFSIGIGNYTETDVKEAARALTGWTVANGKPQFVAERHDDGEKEILGRRGTFTADDLLAVLLEHPATSRRLAWRICGMFFGEGVVSDAALAELAAGLKEHALDIDWAVVTILRSRLFFSRANLRTRALGPAEYVVGALRALGMCQPPPSTLLLADWVARMGQDLFNPPNVGGWKEGRTWLTSRGVLARANFAAALVEGRLWTSAKQPDLLNSLPKEYRGGDLAATVRALAELLWGEVQAAIVEDCLAAIKDIDDDDERIAAAVYWLLTRPESQLG